MYQIISEQSIYQYFGDDDPDMTKEMIQIILDTNIKDLKELNEFYKIKDFDTIKRRCHKAKPTMSYIGALKTRKLLEEIDANLEDSSEINNSLQKHLDVIIEELNEFLETIK
ncbi:Hpt domain-containing protein [Algoriphagus lutimaris]|uniref:Hpt domain-containing protein n=1 Tax=Algoriphagus lutimaris TaxID=613197 RepID=UPI00196B095C|nr:Hpt domain-containing protein [Algoriphagus lutimaris]MBN3519022.1 Hpt domain-containing protein [Algoriphagus lutimaris]